MGIRTSGRTEGAWRVQGGTDERPALSNDTQKLPPLAWPFERSACSGAAGAGGFKIVAGHRLTDEFGYTFHHPDPMAEAP